MLGKNMGVSHFIIFNIYLCVAEFVYYDDRLYKQNSSECFCVCFFFNFKISGFHNVQ